MPYFLLFVLPFAIIAFCAVDNKELTVSIYPPPVSDDYYYRVTIYCNRHSNSSETEAGPYEKLIAERNLHGTIKAAQNVEQGQFMGNGEQNARNMGTLMANGNNHNILVAPAKASITFGDLKEKLKKCAKNEVFIKIVKFLAVGNVTERKEKLLKVDTMTIEKFTQTDILEYDFEEEYSKTFVIISKQEKQQQFEFTVSFEKASGLNNQGMMYKQEFVVYRKTLTMGGGHLSVKVTVPISKEHKISERRGDIKLHFKQTDNDSHGDGTTRANIVKVYWINEEEWYNNEAFTVDLNETKVKPTKAERQPSYVKPSAAAEHKSIESKGKTVSAKTRIKSAVVIDNQPPIPIKSKASNAIKPNGQQGNQIQKTNGTKRNE